VASKTALAIAGASGRIDAPTPRCGNSGAVVQHDVDRFWGSLMSKIG
jgi:hypothetical protein